MNNRRQVLCRLDALPEGAAKGFVVAGPSGDTEIFAVRKNGCVVAYRNSCPHTGGPLDWVPDQFLNLEGDLIQCATHDALFRIDDGVCIAGPCAGERLSGVRVLVEDDVVYADFPPIERRGRPRDAGR